MFQKKILYFAFVIIILWSQLGLHTYNFTDYSTWVEHIQGKKIFLINGRDYCVCTNLGLFFNEYTCTQNIIFKQNYIDATEHNISQIISVETNKINYLSWIIIIYGLYIVISFIFSFINSFFSILYKLFLSPKQSDSNSDSYSDSDSNSNTISNTNSNSNSNSSLTSILDNLYGTSLFGNSSQNIEVKTDSDPLITINNFIGCANIKKEISKVINQIKYNDIYKDYFCELPKGILLIGPPGVGKTHLVKTIINATGMKYIFMSGSDFNKIFVGSGSSTVAQLFKKARENKPCLIFIDEADTILKKRSHNETSSVSTEFGATICKFLAEMDSLKTESGVVVVFATNMDENYIDKGIMRAGRIDQIIHINHPTLEERIELFKMYLKRLYNEEQIDLNKIAKLSYGLTGSDIKKIVNLILINKVNEYIEKNEDKICSISNVIDSKNKIKNYFLDEDIPLTITTSDIDKEISKCILGLERERKINQMNKKIIAYHEAGHAIMAYLIKDSVIPSKICISINSKSLGYTLFPQEDDDLLMKTSIKQLLIEVMILYAGRASEKIFVGEVTCGAEDDYMKARKILKRLIMNGMIVPEYNFVSKSDSDEKIPEYIEKQLISINKLILKEVENLLKTNWDIVHMTAEKIIEFGSIVSDDIDEIFKNESMEEKIHSYDISEIYNLILSLHQ